MKVIKFDRGAPNMTIITHGLLQNPTAITPLTSVIKALFPLKFKDNLNQSRTIWRRQ